jgi:hypothetical protein
MTIGEKSLRMLLSISRFEVRLGHFATEASRLQRRPISAAAGND